MPIRIFGVAQDAMAQVWRVRLLCSSHIPHHLSLWNKHRSSDYLPSLELRSDLCAPDQGIRSLLLFAFPSCTGFSTPLLDPAVLVTMFTSPPNPTGHHHLQERSTSELLSRMLRSSLRCPRASTCTPSVFRWHFRLCRRSCYRSRSGSA